MVLYSSRSQLICIYRHTGRCTVSKDKRHQTATPPIHSGVLLATYLRTYLMFGGARRIVLQKNIFFCRKKAKLAQGAIEKLMGDMSMWTPRVTTSVEAVLLLSNCCLLSVQRRSGIPSPPPPRGSLRRYSCLAFGRALGSSVPFARRIASDCVLTHVIIDVRFGTTYIVSKRKPL